MINPDYFINKLQEFGIFKYAGVPCSYLEPLIISLEKRIDLEYIATTSEGEAVSVATGSWMGDECCAVICQNSGLGNMVNPLTSLTICCDIPVLLIISWRGQPGMTDEPQHKLMGEITTRLLELLGIEYSVLPKSNEEVSGILAIAEHRMRQVNKPYAIIIKKDTFENPDATRQCPTLFHNNFPDRFSVLSALSEITPNDSPVISTTGKTSRELFTIADKDNYFYCVGAMGFASAVAHGISVSLGKKVYIIDGDGSALMHLGNLSTIGHYQPELVHIVLDNSCYDSTGGQPSSANTVDFSSVARACGYKRYFNVETVDELKQKIISNRDVSLPILISIRIRSGSLKNLGRPSISPTQVALRLRNYFE